MPETFINKLLEIKKIIGHIPHPQVYTYILFKIKDIFY